MFLRSYRERKFPSFVRSWGIGTDHGIGFHHLFSIEVDLGIVQDTTFESQMGGMNTEKAVSQSVLCYHKKVFRLNSDSQWL